ncbi:MAG: DUF3179 domain-containing protein [Deltaproteobacteria bacterium]|nr:DUF3179 domain-containing protein [Deltaproteobacteria bacterium]
MDSTPPRSRPPAAIAVSLALLASIALAMAPARAVELTIDPKTALVPVQDIIPGGPPPDGIPPIDRPVFVSVKEAGRWLRETEPVVAFEWRGDARAYPLQILIWHEIVNDTVGGKPVSVTYCPLCNSALAFDRVLEGTTHDFGTSGMLYHSDLVMYDRQTRSLWAQMEGRAIVGKLAGKRLTVLPTAILAWRDWREAHPQGKVLSRETGHNRPYGRNPYAGYDAADSYPFLFKGKADTRLRPMERVVAISVGEQAKAYPVAALSGTRVLHDIVNGQPLVIFYAPGTVSALDQAEIARSREVGATGVFDPHLDGKRLAFRFDGQAIRDRETGSTWNILGVATAGPLTGRRLTRLAHVDTFWFAWAAFKPHTALHR